jgi:protein-tyrosine-phosphatase
MDSRVLYVCTGNSARSQLAEAVTRFLGARHGVEAFSAGSSPRAQVHPMVFEVLETLGVPCTNLAPKPVALFEGQSFAYVVTLCDRAKEACPTFVGASTTHWALSDPADGPADSMRAAFDSCAVNIWMRVSLLLEFHARHGDARKSGPIERELLALVTSVRHAE